MKKISIIFRKIIAHNFFLLRLFLKIREFVNPDKDETTGTSDGSYCYSLFLRVVESTTTNQANFSCNKSLEVGCGDTFTVSCLLYILGVDSIHVIDAQKYIDKDKTLRSLDIAFEMLIEKQFATYNINPPLDPKVYEFIWNQKGFNSENLISRYKKVRMEIENIFKNRTSNIIKYIAPYEVQDIESNYDLIFSQAVFEHVIQPFKLLDKLHNSLSKNGIVYTCIDYKSHGISPLKNGQYLLSEDQYVKICSPYTFRFINRIPDSKFHEYFQKEQKILDRRIVKISNHLNSNKIKSELKPEDLEIGSTRYISMNK